MPKRACSSNQDSNSTIQEIMSKIKAMVTLIFLLTSTNYHLKVMRMEVYLEAHGLWEAIIRSETNRKSYWQALLAIHDNMQS